MRIVNWAGAEMRGSVKDVDVQAVAQGACIELCQQSIKAVKPFGTQPYNGYRVRPRKFARLDSWSQFIIPDLPLTSLKGIARLALELRLFPLLNSLKSPIE